MWGEGDFELPAARHENQNPRTDRPCLESQSLCPVLMPRLARFENRVLGRQGATQVQTTASRSQQAVSVQSDRATEQPPTRPHKWY